MPRPPVADLALAGGLVVAGVAATAATSHWSAPVGAPGYPLVALAAAALAVRRGRPLGTLTVVALCASVHLLLGYAYGPVLLVLMIAVYSAFRHAATDRAVRFAAVALGLLLVHLAVTDRRLGRLGVLPVTAWVVVPAAVGYGLRTRAEAAARARAETVRQRVDDERLRVAQEVHDIVGHGLAAIKMQADIALHVLARQPGQAEQALTAISRTSGQALDELRATLAAVRRADDRAPAVGLDGLEELRRRMADAGVRVCLDTVGERAARLPAAVDLAGYRVVQESLTNVLRHGAVAEAAVTVRYEPDGVAITVANPIDEPPRPRAGSGIAGMRARVEALGGRFTAGPVGTRFEVHCRLPTVSRP